MRKIILGLLLVFGLEASAYLPHKGDSKEFRLVSTTQDFSKFAFHGVIVGGQLLHKDVKIAGVMEMNSELSAMKALVEYHLNNYVKVGLIAGLNNKGNGLGDMILTGNIPVGAVDILPFLKVSHEVIAESGAVVYLNIKKAVFNLGFSYRPKLGNSKTHQLLISIGTGIK